MNCDQLVHLKNFSKGKFFTFMYSKHYATC